MLLKQKAAKTKPTIVFPSSAMNCIQIGMELKFPSLEMWHSAAIPGTYVALVLRDETPLVSLHSTLTLIWNQPTSHQIPPKAFSCQNKTLTRHIYSYCVKFYNTLNTSSGYPKKYMFIKPIKMASIPSLLYVTWQDAFQMC